jgi:hypothetical protein
LRQDLTTFAQAALELVVFLSLSPNIMMIKSGRDYKSKPPQPVLSSFLKEKTSYLRHYPDLWIN